MELLLAEKLALVAMEETYPETMDFQFELSLRHSSLIAAALFFWEQKETKEKLREYFLLHVLNQAATPSEATGKAENKWISLTAEIIKKVDESSLPHRLYYELAYVIKELGKKIYDWFHVGIKLLEPYDSASKIFCYDLYLKDIFWTNQGLIDEVKIFRSWLRIPQLNKIKIYSLACLYCLEEEVKDLWKEVANKIKKPEEKVLYPKYEYHWVIYWQRERDNNLESFISDVKKEKGDGGNIYDESFSTNVNMLRLAVAQENVTAVKYFWKKLTFDEKQKHLMYCLAKLITLWNVRDEKAAHRRDKCTLLCLFFVNQLKLLENLNLFDALMATKQYRSFSAAGRAEVIFFLCMFVFRVPWESFFSLFFLALREHLSTSDQELMLKHTAFKMFENTKYGLPPDNSKNQEIFQEVWSMITPDFKRSIINNGDVLITLSLVWNSKSMSILLNDASISEEEREDLLRRMHSRSQFIHNFSELFDEGKEETIVRYIYELLISKKWDRTTQLNVKKAYESILAGVIDSDLNLAGKINTDIVCWVFIKKNQYIAADNFLKWKYSSQEEIKAVKDKFKDSVLSVDHIFHLWSAYNFEEANKLSTNFLNWFLESEDEIIEFIDRKIYRKDLGTWSVRRLILSGHFQIIQDFLLWCSAPKDLFKVKKEFISDGIKSMCKTYMENHDSAAAQKLFKWVFYSERQMQHFLEKFLLSKFGIDCCKLFIRDMYRSDRTVPKENFNKIKDFVDVWLKPLRNLDEFINIMEKWGAKSEENKKREYPLQNLNLDNFYEKDRSQFEVFMNLARECKRDINPTREPAL